MFDDSRVSPCDDTSVVVSFSYHLKLTKRDAPDIFCGIREIINFSMGVRWYFCIAELMVTLVYVVELIPAVGRTTYEIPFMPNRQEMPFIL